MASKQGGARHHMAYLAAGQAAAVTGSTAAPQHTTVPLLTGWDTTSQCKYGEKSLRQQLVPGSRGLEIPLFCLKHIASRYGIDCSTLLRSRHRTQDTTSSYVRVCVCCVVRIMYRHSMTFASRLTSGNNSYLTQPRGTTAPTASPGCSQGCTTAELAHNVSPLSKELPETCSSAAQLLPFPVKLLHICRITLQCTSLIRQTRRADAY